MTDDINSGSECRIELVYSVEARIESAGQPSSFGVGDKLAKIQGIIERAIAAEFRNAPLLASTDVRFRRSVSSSNPRPRRMSPYSSKKDIILGLLQSKDGVTTKALQGATGWKPSTVFAQLDYLSKTGHSINRLRDDGVLRYRLA